MLNTLERPDLPIEAINGFLAELDDWALLRNDDLFANFQRGGDCDLVVGNLEGAGRLLVKKLGKPVRIARRSYIHSYYYSWGHFDLTDHYYWRGLRLLPGRSLLEDAGGQSKWPLVSEEDEIIIKLLASLLWGGFIKKRYAKDIHDLAMSREGPLKARLTMMVGPEAARRLIAGARNEEWELLEKRAPQLRTLVKRYCSRRAPFQSLLGRVNFLFHELTVRLRNIVPVLRIQYSEGFDHDELKEFLKNNMEVIDYHLLIVEEPDSLLRKWKVLINSWSFRARNGLLVMTSDRESSEIGYWPVRYLTLPLDSLSAKSLLPICEEFFEFSRRHCGNR